VEYVVVIFPAQRHEIVMLIEGTTAAEKAVVIRLQQK
jgi:hypothetical protein